MITKLELRALIFFSCILAPVIGRNCESFSSSDYICNENESKGKCRTYAILRANPHYSSLSNLSYYLGLSRFELAEANGLSTESDILSSEQPLLIPIECKCSDGGIFEAELKKTTVEGESFYEIAESLEGLTSCKAIQEKNPRVSASNLEERINLSVPLKCACPPQAESGKLLLSYPVKEGDTLPELALRFNVTEESLVSSNRKYSRTGFNQESSLVPLSTVLIPAEGKPTLNFFSKPEEPSSRNPAGIIQVRDSHKRKKPKMWMIGVYIAIGLTGLLASIGIGAALVFFFWKRKRQDSIKNINADLELQQLSLSVRTTSDKKISFEGSQYNFEDPVLDSTTPHKIPVENYTFEELQKATEDFSLSNLIEGSVFHGRLKGKNLAIKRTKKDVISKIDYMIFQERIHRHPNIIRFMGTCSPPVSGAGSAHDSFIVFEYAKNGSLKDWIHGGLAIKSHFIASCNCFLTWNQRLKICLDVATALQYMHHIINPSYVHRNIRSRNIFLDEDFNAKIGNFGLAKCVGLEVEDQNSCSIQASWNKGYLAPEYDQSSPNGSISTSIDVFAYGVVLLEVLSGKPPVEERGEGEFVKLCDEIKQILKSEDAEGLREWMDGALGENYSFDAAVTVANLARSCLEDDPAARPNAGEIMEKLRRLVEELPDGDQFNSISESSCKPLVSAVARDR